MQLFISYLKQQKSKFIFYVLFCSIFLISFLLYHLPPAAVVYPSLICAMIGLAFLLYHYSVFYRKHTKLQELQKLTASLLIDALPSTSKIEEEDYNQLIRLLCEEQKHLLTEMNTKFADMVDYYTIWAHQIKTPIASMRLHLQNEDSILSRKLSSDLFRIEQYVEMVLMFLRLDSDTTDYVIKEYDLDDIVKNAIKKFSSEFITRKIRLEYEPLTTKVITDEKWLSFVIEQLLSNALKYTKKGSISIRLEEPKVLCICDTGIGIAPEDLPRIFDKGYTGYNGRKDKKASGIGLYLCKRICHNLGHTIRATSSFDNGTIMRVDLTQRNLEIE